MIPATVSRAFSNSVFVFGAVWSEAMANAS